MKHWTESSSPFWLVTRSRAFENEHEMMVVAAYLWEVSEVILAALTDMDYKV